MTDPAIAARFPASVAVERNERVVRFRIAGLSRKAVLNEIVRIRSLCEAHPGAWLRLMGPQLQGGEYVCHVVLRQR